MNILGVRNGQHSKRLNCRNNDLQTYYITYGQNIELLHPNTHSLWDGFLGVCCSDFECPISLLYLT